jgi:hypothetical protein
MVYKQISGNGIFKDSLKTLGKYALFELKNLWKNALKPKAIVLTKGVELGKDLLKENKGNIQKIVSKQSQNILKKLMNKERIDKQGISKIKNDLTDLVKEVKKY